MSVTGIAPQAPAAPLAAVVPETPAALASPEAAKADEQLSPRFAALAKQTKIIRQQQQALKVQEDALKMKMQEYEQNYIPKDRIKSDPISVLTENGYTYDQIAQYLLNQAGPQDPYQKRMEAKIAELEKKSQEPMKKFEEIQTQQREQAISQIRAEAKALVASDPAFETIKEMGADEAVVKLITETYDKLGQLLSVEEASSQVEEELLTRALKIASIAKVKAKLNPVPEAAAPIAPISQKLTGYTTQLKTLTNAQVASPSKPKNAMDRVQRAKLAFLGQLNQ